MQTAFQVTSGDNVATALDEITPGRVALAGDVAVDGLTATEVIPTGHKIALRPIAQNDPIVKYGAVIGRATMDIPAGSWVHLHVMQSNYDERASHLDVRTGAAMDTVYE